MLLSHSVCSNPFIPTNALPATTTIGIALNTALPVTNVVRFGAEKLGKRCFSPRNGRLI